MTILQRYALREMAGPLGLGLVVFTFVFLVGQLFKLTALLLNNGVPVRLAMELIASLLPGILSWTIPMAVLVAILLGIGRLAADREILAIRMSGVNLMHICVPIIGLAAVLSAAMMFANRNLVPYLNLKSTDLRTELWFQIHAAFSANQFHTLETGKENESSMFFFDHRDAATGEMKGVTIKTQIEQSNEQPEQALREPGKLLKAKAKGDGAATDGRKAKAAQGGGGGGTAAAPPRKSVRETLVVAESGHISADIAERLISIELTTGSIHLVDVDRPTAYNIVRFATFSKAFRPGITKDSGVYRKNPREMKLAELRQQIKLPGKQRNAALVEYYQRFSIPLACIAFALVAIPLGVYARPTGKAVAFAISFLLILLYYGLLQYGISLGKTGSGIAPLAIFFPNVLLSVVGSFLLYRMVMK